MRNIITLKQRKELETKMSKALHTNIKGLSAELQKIMVDDMVTAFQNRINVLTKAHAEARY